MTPGPKRNGNTGRFPLPPEKRKHTWGFLATVEDAERIRRAAEAEGRSFSGFVCRAASKAAEKILGGGNET